MASRSPYVPLPSLPYLPNPWIFDFQSDKIIALTNAAGVELEPIWASLLAKALEGKNIKELLSNVGSGGGAPAAGGAAPAAGGGAAAEAPKEEEKKVEEKEESDDDMVSLISGAAKGWMLIGGVGLRSLRLNDSVIFSFALFHIHNMSCCTVLAEIV